MNISAPFTHNADCPDTHLPLWDEIKLNSIDRWMLFYRLQTLSIQAECAHGQPLRVQITTASEAIQLWGAIRTASADRQTLLTHLARCWKAIPVNS